VCGACALFSWQSKRSIDCLIGWLSDWLTCVRDCCCSYASLQIAHLTALLAFAVDARPEVCTHWVCPVVAETAECPAGLACPRVLQALRSCVDVPQCWWTSATWRLSVVPCCCLHLTFVHLHHVVRVASQIRTVAAGSLQVVLARHHEAKFEVAASHVAQFCLSVLKAATARETAQTVLLIEFLKAGLPLLPRQQTSAVVEALLRLAQLSVVRFTAACLRLHPPPHTQSMCLRACAVCTPFFTQSCRLFVSISLTARCVYVPLLAPHAICQPSPLISLASRP
jgi:hypothetical protein